MSKSSQGTSAGPGVVSWLSIGMILVALLAQKAATARSKDDDCFDIFGCESDCGSKSCSEWKPTPTDKPVQPGEYPFLVSINNDCSGSIIGKRHIITAARCVEENIATPELLEVKIGLHKRADSKVGKLVEIKEVMVHLDYSEDPYSAADFNAIAILKTTLPMNFTARQSGSGAVGAINLPRCDCDDNEGDRLIVAGWGITKAGSKTQLPKKAEVEVIDIEDCDETIYLNGRGDSREVMCARHIGKKGLCLGASGSPLFRKNGDKNGHGQELVGLVSYGRKCHGSGGITVYTRVAKYLGWIKAMMAL